MDQIERQMINIVNLNHDIKKLERRLSAISASRKRKSKKKAASRW